MSKQVISFAWPQFITKLSSFLGNRIDVLLIGIFLTPYYITVYNVVYQFYLLITTVISLFGSAIFPYVSELYSRNSKESIKKLYLTGTRYSMFVSLPLVIGAFLLANPFLKAWVGQEYSIYSYLVQIFLVAAILMSSRVIAVQITLSLDLIRHLIKYHAIGAVVNFFISIILIQYIGIAGIIIGTVIGYLIVWYPSNSIVLKRLGIKNVDFLYFLILKPVIAALISIPFLLLLNFLAAPNTLLLVLLYGSFYAVLFVLPFFYIGFNRIERDEMIGLVKQTFVSS
jgi:O-antigen/teichoic acid export membrane protein